MGDDGRRLNLSDDEWDKRFAEIEQNSGLSNRRTRRAVHRLAGGGRRRRETRSRSRRPRGHVFFAVLGVLLAAAVVVGALVELDHGHRTTIAGRSPAAGHPTSSGGTPYGGTPAAGWDTADVALRLPAARAVGPYNQSLVAAALARARTYLLTARTDRRILVTHDLSALDSIARSGAGMAPGVRATLLESHNSLAAPVRMRGSADVSFVPALNGKARYLEVSGNFVWAYALTAGYDVAPGSDGVVTVHEDVRLAFYLDADQDGPNAKPTPLHVEVLRSAMDCGYSHDDLITLPRVDDPRRDPAAPQVADDRYDPNADLSRTGGCTPD